MFLCHLSSQERDGNEGGDSCAQLQFATENKEKKKKKGEGGAKGLASSCRRLGGCRIKRGEVEKLKKLERQGGRIVRGQVLYSLGRAVVITDGCIETPYQKQQN